MEEKELRIGGELVLELGEQPGSEREGWEVGACAKIFKTRTGGVGRVRMRMLARGLELAE